MNSSRVRLRFQAGRVGSVRGGTLGGLSWAAGCYVREPSAVAGRFRLGRAGVGKGSGCWAGLGFHRGFGPVPDRN
jgi:hypothetical protein